MKMKMYKRHSKPFSQGKYSVAVNNGLAHRAKAQVVNPGDH